MQHSPAESAQMKAPRQATPAESPLRNGTDSHSHLSREQKLLGEQLLLWPEPPPLPYVP